MRNTIVIIFLLIFSSTFSQQTIPSITLSTLDGEKVDVSELSNSKEVKVFAFWATWCVPCINELDAISDIYEDWIDETNVEIIAVSTDDTRTKKRIKPLVNGKDWDYKILLDDNQELKRALNISLIPYVIVVKEGEIVYKHSGYSPGSEEDLYEIIKKYAE